PVLLIRFQRGRRAEVQLANLVASRTPAATTRSADLRRGPFGGALRLVEDDRDGPAAVGNARPGPVAANPINLGRGGKTLRRFQSGPVGGSPADGADRLRRLGFGWHHAPHGSGKNSTAWLPTHLRPQPSEFRASSASRA